MPEREKEKETNVAVIGSGPAGIYTTKGLVSHGIKTTIFEKEKHPYGLYKCGFSPYKFVDKDLFKPIINDKNVTLLTNTKVEDLKTLENDFDAFVVATGSQTPRQLNIIGAEHCYQGIDIAKSYNECNAMKFNFGKRTAIIGCGNVAMDVSRHLFKMGVKNVDILCRRGIFDGAFGNKYLYVINKENVNIMTNTKIKKELKFRKKNDILTDKDIGRAIYFTTEKNFPQTMKFKCSTLPVEIMKFDDKYILKHYEKSKLKYKVYDAVVMAIGFQNNIELKTDVKKPVYYVGWAKTSTGSLGSIRKDAENTVDLLLEKLGLNKSESK